MARHGYEYAITKSGPPPDIKRIGKDDYPHHERASTSYTHYITGYTEEEIADFLTEAGIKCETRDVERDIQHIQSLLPTRTVIAHENDRNRLLIQRNQGKQYRALLKEALAIKAKDYVESGLSPAGPLKEFREAVGMTERPGGINLQVNQQNVNVGSSQTASGINSSEDLLRSVMAKMRENQAALPAETRAIEVEAVTEAAPALMDDNEDEGIPDPDE